MEHIHKLLPHQFPPLLNEIYDPPTQLYAVGNLPDQNNKILCVVGSRDHTDYGSEVCENLIKGLEGYNVSIVSGLALGIDTIAHTTAIQYGLQTIAVPGSGLDHSVLYPKANLDLAQQIVKYGGGLLSEFDTTFTATPWSFPQRNRIMAGLSHAVLVIEAEVPSGTLITSKYATDYNRDVLTVPGSIFSSHSDGPHMLLKLGATPITSSHDILDALNIPQKNEK